ncbi:MAG: hypothetical protein LW715_13220 [Rhodobacter sp.]|nr:hypothetical protein [Rhodobacter sp.]
MRLRAFTVLTILVLACGAAGSAHETGLETETEVTGDAKIRVFEGVAAPNPADAGDLTFMELSPTITILSASTQLSRWAWTASDCAAPIGVLWGNCPVPARIGR